MIAMTSAASLKYVYCICSYSCQRASIYFLEAPTARVLLARDYCTWSVVVLLSGRASLLCC